VLLASSGSTFPNAMSSATAIPDLSAVRAVAIKGDASAIRITTRSDRPYAATLGARRKGWFSSWYSSWFFADCREASGMRLEGPVLRIEVAASQWLDPSDCTIEVEANVPAGSAVRVDQNAFTAQLKGYFSEIAVAGNAADVSLDGHASTVEIRADAVRASLAYDRVEQDESVRIDARAIDVYLGFGQSAAIDYSVRAKASWVDSLHPSVPGSRPSVEIDGDFVRARIR
jgi:hypothetical protein